MSFRGSNFAVFLSPTFLRNRLISEMRPSGTHPFDFRSSVRATPPAIDHLAALAVGLRRAGSNLGSFSFPHLIIFRPPVWRIQSLRFEACKRFRPRDSSETRFVNAPKAAFTNLFKLAICSLLLFWISESPYPSSSPPHPHSSLYADRSSQRLVGQLVARSLARWRGRPSVRSLVFPLAFCWSVRPFVRPSVNSNSVEVFDESFCRRLVSLRERVRVPTDRVRRHVDKTTYNLMNNELLRSQSRSSSSEFSWKGLLEQTMAFT